ncbi:Ig-like domain-containing protein [Clostridium botulinum]|uniref:Ig-like domain-containing protein n=1 Tax=Clostridium botulinum TaxID=1491 RepID=UPI0001AADBC8|nr:Ig-like domain-containing protein [Clostridium botulinum]EES50191.1 Ig group 2 domain protein [Clostridium botulinum E1 str. 'BoNT E Beluga']
MKNYYKKLSIIFIMAFAIILGNSINAWAASSITTDKSVYAPGEKIYVTYKLDNVNLLKKLPWIGIVPANVPHGSEEVNDRNDVAFQRPTNSSNLSFVFVAPDKSGTYDFRLNDADDNGVEIMCSPTFVVSSNSISLNKSTDNLQIGQTDNLIATTTPSAVDVTWSSSDETVATVDSNGNVKAIKEGQATITAQIKGKDIKADCIVTVTKKDTVPEPTDPEQEYIINTAYAKGDNTNNASGQVSIIFKGVTEAQLKVVKTADVDSVYVGDNFTYTIEVTNTSDKTAKSVIIKDSAPNHIQFIPSGVTTTQGTIDSNSTAKNIIVNVGDIPPLGKVIIKIPVLVVE